MENSNSVETKTIAELRDGRIFYIPAYQRGYRWNQKQVEDLLNDLYTFATKEKKQNGEFYCLQPIIVKEITDANKRQIIIGDAKIGDADNKPIYEVIDGQQRLTSLYILMRYLINNSNYKKIEKQEAEKHNLYKLTFETRVNMFQYLSTIEDQQVYKNIDEKHAYETYQWIEEWMCKKEDLGDEVDLIIPILKKLLAQGKDTKESCGSVQVIWYEISEDKDVVREFLSTNNGKIGLTDAELIKALFLQKRKFGNVEGDRKQLEKAMQWEQIENTLHQDDFWYFINHDTSVPSNRIECVLRLAIGKDDKMEKGDLFRAYNSYFDGKKDNELEQAISEQWGKIVDCYRTLEDWYLDPITYNYIGYLVHAEKSVYDVWNCYQEIKDNDNQDVFVKKLEQLVKKSLSGITREGDFINKKYKNKKEIRKVLLLVNVEIINNQLKELRKKQDTNLDLNSPSYKFPFDVYINQQWDVEHIDSQTTNTLSKDIDKQNWVNGYVSCMDGEESFMDLYEKGQWDDCIKKIQEKYEETDTNKDEIGNLTLLDAQINRSYGNAIFPDKRKRILEEIRNGKYVPYCTQMVFYKNFNIDETRPVWNEECKAKYGQFIVQQVSKYLNK